MMLAPVQESKHAEELANMTHDNAIRQRTREDVVNKVFVRFISLRPLSCCIVIRHVHPVCNESIRKPVLPTEIFHSLVG